MKYKLFILQRSCIIIMQIMMMMIIIIVIRFIYFLIEVYSSAFDLFIQNSPNSVVYSENSVLLSAFSTSWNT